MAGIWSKITRHEKKAMSLANQSTLTQMLELTEDSNYNCIPIFKKLNRAEGFHKWCLEAFQNLSKDGKGLYLTEMEWMNLVMYNWSQEKNRHQSPGWESGSCSIGLCCPPGWYTSKPALPRCSQSCLQGAWAGSSAGSSSGSPKVIKQVIWIFQDTNLESQEKEAEDVPLWESRGKAASRSPPTNPVISQSVQPQDAVRDMGVDQWVSAELIILSDIWILTVSQPDGKIKHGSRKGLQLHDE